MWGDFPVVGNQIMVAWDGSREATRAIHDALPFLMRAQRVTIITVNEAAARPEKNGASGPDIAAAIARHGVKVEVSALEGVHDSTIGNVLLSQASDLNADLLVMGAYGHSRVEEFVFGGYHPRDHEDDNAARALVTLTGAIGSIGQQGIAGDDIS